MGIWELDIRFEVLAAAVDLCLAGYAAGAVEYEVERQTPGSVTYRMVQAALGDLGIVRVRALSAVRSELAIGGPPLGPNYDARKRHLRGLVVPAFFDRLRHESIWENAEPPAAPPKRPPHPDVVKRDEQIRKYWEANLTDQKIADRLFCSVATVRRARGRLKLRNR